MKRKFNVLVMLIPVLFAVLIVLPVGSAQRRAGSNGAERVGDDAAGKSQKDKAGRKGTGKAALTPVSAKAVSFAISPALRDLPERSRLMRDPKAPFEVKGRPRKSIGREANDASVASKDAALQTSVPSPRISSPIVSFEGQSILDTIALGQGFLPPDTVGDVGPNHYVQMVNSTFRIWDKTGTPVAPIRSLADIWATIPGQCATSEDGDPIVLYDSLADRWLLSQFCTVANPNNHQLIAISQTGDPTGAYYLYDFMMPNNKFNDYPKFGVWPDGYYMTDNQFNQAGTAFLGGGVFAFDRAKMLAGDPTATFIYFDLFTLDPTIGGMLPADADGLTPPPAGAPNVFAYFIATEFGDASDGLRLFNFHADFAVPANSTFVERAESPIAVAAFDPSTPAGRDNIEQPPPANNATAALDAIGDRLMHRLQYRHFGTHESLITNHTVNVGTGTTLALHQAGVRYYELRRSGGAYSVNEQASFAPDAVNRWMASAAMDNQGNLAVGYSVSDATTVFPGIRYAGRLAGDPPNGLFQGEATLQVGGFVQTHTSSRWGDYSSMNVDPVDDCTFWYTQEYYLNDVPMNISEWHTRIGSFKVNATCTAPAQGTLQVNVTNCGTGLPVQGATVSVDSNIYDSTEANGQSVSKLSPGSYSVLVSHPLYLAAAPANQIITNGNTTTFNTCLTGAPAITPGGSALTAESCVPADNALSTGEIVTVDFGLKNSGTAATTNLVATLQATGGVTSPSGSQNYGAIPPDNTTVVSRPFTFTVDPSAACGSQVTATFQLQDGATGLGTVTFTLQVGALTGGTVSANYSSGNIAVPIPDVASVDVPINVPDVGAVNDVNVRVRLNHTFDGDLEISLVHPDGTVVLLSDNRGGSGNNFGTGTSDCSGTPTIFDDEAGTTIASGSAPFAGSFRPDQMLSALDGKLTNGTWKVRFSDTAMLDTGTVGCVTLELSRTQFVCCSIAGTPPLASTTLAINEFRLRGALGALDEYIEIVNMSGSPFTVNAGDASAGWSVAALDAAGTVASIVATIPNGTMIPARGHYLIANNTAAVGYSLANYGGAGNATPDATYTADIADNTGVALFNTANVANLSAATRIDTVNFTSQNGAQSPLFTEGTRLAPITGGGEYAFVRKLNTGLPRDTGDNAADFDFVSTTAGTFGVLSVRGAPGPENLASPLQRNATVKAGLIDPTQPSNVPPNRVRDATPGTGATALGTLDIRRKFTNNTGVIITRLRFRAVDITTTNTPGGPLADLRILTSGDTTANGGTITIRGTALESPSDAVAGGGSNASVVVAIPGGFLAPGASVNVRYLLGVAQGGTFRFFVNVEALP
ncbi:MAG: proprotein convertase P-domain-containing protein [Pyrinomonadaceae bacterium]